MENELQSLEAEARKGLELLTAADHLEPFRVRFLGRKGAFSTIMRQLGSVPAEERPRVGQLANTIKADIERLFEEKKEMLSAGQGRRGVTTPDLSLPGRWPATGRLHPISQVMEDLFECCVIPEQEFATCLLERGEFAASAQSPSPDIANVGLFG